MNKYLIALMAVLQFIGVSPVVYAAAPDLSSPVVFNERMSSSGNAGVCRVLAHALESKRLQLESLKSDLSGSNVEVQFSGLVQTGAPEILGVDDVMSQHLRARLAVYASEREYFNGLCVKQTSN